MKVATCLQHVPFEGPGVFRQALGKRGYTVKTTLVPTEGVPSDFGDFLLIMGGPMSVNDSEDWIAEEQKFVQEAMNRNMPVLGICFGAQLLAKVCGGSVLPGAKFEIGVLSVIVTDAGKSDPVFGRLPPEFHVFQWHGEGIVLPSAVKSLIASKDFPVQAFRSHDFGYGILFHAEIEEAGMEALCRECPDDVKKGGIPSEAIQAQARAHLPFLHQLADQLIEHLIP